MSLSSFIWIATRYMQGNDACDSNKANQMKWHSNDNLSEPGWCYSLANCSHTFVGKPIINRNRYILLEDVSKGVGPHSIQ